VANRTAESALLAASGPYSGSSGITNLLGTVLPQTIGGLNDTMTNLSQSFGSLVSTSQSQAEAVLANTQAIVQSTSSRSTGGVTGMLGQAASSILGGMGFSPIISGLLDLFGSSSPATPPPLTPFTLPPSISFQAANVGPSNGSGLPGADYGQSGLPRVMQDSSGSGSAAQPAATSNVTINVQAMDSRSFLDHSSDIANAVRDAMLNMHSLNDVVSDL